MHKLAAYISGVALLFFVLAVQAGSPALTDAQVRGFIASLPELEVLGEKYPDLDNDDDEDDDDDHLALGNSMSSEIAKLRGHAMYAPLAQLVKRHGFSSPEQWGQVGDRVILALLAASMDEGSANVHAQMAEAMKQIDENPALSVEQRAEMKQMMSGGMGFMQSLEQVPAADIQAIRPYLAELQGLMLLDEDGDW